MEYFLLAEINTFSIIAVAAEKHYIFKLIDIRISFYLHSPPGSTSIYNPLRNDNVQRQTKTAYHII